MSTDVRSILARRVNDEAPLLFASNADRFSSLDEFLSVAIGPVPEWLDATSSDLERFASALYPDGVVRDAVLAGVASRYPLLSLWVTADFNAELFTHWPIQVGVTEVAGRLAATEDADARLVAAVLLHGGFLTVGGVGPDGLESANAVPQGGFLNYGMFPEKELPQHPLWRLAVAMQRPVKSAFLAGAVWNAEGRSAEPINAHAPPAFDEEAFSQFHGRVSNALTRWDPFLVAQFVAVERASHLVCAREAARLLRAEYADDLDSQVRTVLEKVRPVSDANDDEARRQLVAATRAELETLSAALGLDDADPTTEAEAGAVVDDMLSWDAKLAAFLEKFGEQGKVGAESVRKRAREQLQQFRADAVRPLRFRTARALDVWALWLGKDRKAVRNVARAVWHARVLPRLEKFSDAPQLRVFGGTAKGDADRFVKLPKIVTPMSWAMGAEGVRVDGDVYAQEPQLVDAFLPKTWQLLPKDHDTRPHQTAWPMAMPDDEPEPFAVAVAASASASKIVRIMGTEAAKLGIVLLASQQVQHGKLARVRLGDLARLVRPTAKRVQPRDLVATAAALDELRALHAFLPDRRKVQVFDVVTPWTHAHATADMEILAGLAGTFREVLADAQDRKLLGGRLRGHEFAGSILVNLDGLLRLPTKQPQLLRVYLRAAAAINAAFHLSDGGFDEKRLPGHTIDVWAALANALPHGVAEYLQAKPGARSKTRTQEASRARKRLREDLDALRDEYRLIEIEKTGDRFKLLPTRSHLQAWSVIREKGTQHLPLLPESEAGG